MTLWHVTTPKYTYIERVLDDGTGPFHEGVDWKEVETPTRRDAIIIAVREWLVEAPYGYDVNYCVQRRRDGLNPYTGVTAKSDGELKLKAHEDGPPAWYDDDEWCMNTEAPHEGSTHYVWVDTHPDPDLRWGWFASCDKHDPHAIRDESFEG